MLYGLSYSNDIRSNITPKLPFFFFIGGTLSLIQATCMSAFIKETVSVLFHIPLIDYMNSKSVN